MCTFDKDKGPRRLMKKGLTLIMVGHVNFILGAIVHGNVLRHVSKPNHVTTEYTAANIISVTSGLLSMLEDMSCVTINVALLVRVLPPLLIGEFIFGVLGNGLVLWIFVFRLRPWNSSHVIFFNLALADFLLHTVLPFRASYYLSELAWRFGHVFCNISLFMLAMNRSGSILFLMTVAVDRYVRVVHPHHWLNSLSVSKAMCGTGVLWLVTFAMTAPLLFHGRRNGTNCESFIIQDELDHSLSWHKCLFVLSFYLPLAVIVYCTFRIVAYLRGRQLAKHARIKRAVWFINVVLVLFIICFLPSNITQIMVWSKTQQNSDCEVLKKLNSAFYITISLTYLNSTLYPLVYYFSSLVFQNICRRLVHLEESITTGIIAILVSRNLPLLKLQIGLMISSFFNALLSAACSVGLLVAISLTVAHNGQGLMQGCNDTEVPINARSPVSARCPFDTTRIYDTTLALWIPGAVMAAVEAGLSIWCFTVGLTLRGLAPCGSNYIKEQLEEEALANRKTAVAEFTQGQSLIVQRLNPEA